MDEAFVSGDVHHLACGICPSRRLPVGEFDVYERPCTKAPFDPSDGFRYSDNRVPVCVHPEKVRLPVANYKSEGAPLNKRVELPATEAELVPHLHDLLYGAAPVLLDDLIEQAYAEIPRVFPDVDVLETLRRALN
ncbi:hypothetical protein ACWGH5_39240 [Streptomyces sp. NPDC054864]